MPAMKSRPKFLLYTTVPLTMSSGLKFLAGNGLNTDKLHVILLL